MLLLGKDGSHGRFMNKRKTFNHSGDLKKIMGSLNNSRTSLGANKMNLNSDYYVTEKNTEDEPITKLHFLQKRIENEFPQLPPKKQEAVANYESALKIGKPREPWESSHGNEDLFDFQLGLDGENPDY